MRTILFTILALALLPLGLDAGDADELIAKDADSKRTCVRIKNIHNYQVIDQNFLFVEASAGKRFLLKTWRRCEGLRTSRRLVITNEMNHMCEGGFAEITFLGSKGPTASSCRIDEVIEVDDLDTAKAIAASIHD